VGRKGVAKVAQPECRYLCFLDGCMMGIVQALDRVSQSPFHPPGKNGSPKVLSRECRSANAASDIECCRRAASPFPLNDLDLSILKINIFFLETKDLARTQTEVEH